ncbi:hypothetical protein PENSPDRAFT_747045 [Peniophora sp. CONT]|nr:hypothetical protein PENSPDRAFT_747045 [Peniophora sp. CONT]
MALRFLTTVLIILVHFILVYSSYTQRIPTSCNPATLDIDTMTIPSEDLSTRAHQLLEEPITGDSSEMAVALSTLGVQLWARFRRMGQTEDLGSAILLLRRAVEITPNINPDKPTSLARLSTSLISRFEYLGELEDLEESIALLHQAVELAPDEHSDKPQLLDKFSRALDSRFERFGELEDLDRSIYARRRAAELTPEDHPTLAVRLDNLGTSLERRYKRLGEVGDLSESISIKQRAVALTPDDEPEKASRLRSLGAALLMRFERLGERDDHVEALLALGHASEFLPDNHPDKARLLMDHGSALYDHFKESTSSNDLERAIAAFSSSMDLLPEGHPDRPLLLGRYAQALLSRFETTLNDDDLERAIASFRMAAELAPDHHPDKSARFYDLATALRHRLERSTTQIDFDAAITSFMTAAAPFAPASQRLTAVAGCSQMHADYPEFSSPASLVQAYAPLFDILSQNIVWIWLSASPRDREFADTLEEHVSAAVAAAIGAGALSQAIEWMEAGRALVYPQILSLRGHIDKLVHSQPVLVQSLRAVFYQLLQPRQLVPVFQNQLSNAPIHLHAQMQDDHRRGLLIEFEQLLDAIRRATGCEDLMRPMKFQTIRSLVERLQAPVILVNVHLSRSDALALAPDGIVTPVALPELTHIRAQRLRLLWLTSLRMRAATPRGGPSSAHAKLLDKQYSGAFSSVLKRLWLWIVYPVLQALDLTSASSDPLPHITWVPTGPLTQLPLHAAGVYDASLPEPAPRAFDFVVSSYLPSFSAIRHFEDEAGDAQTGRVETAANLGITSSSESPKHTPRISEQTTVDAAVATIGQHPCVQLACPGSYNSVDLAQSAFTLSDGPLHLTRLMNAIPDDAELAFMLTAADGETPEASMRMAAGLLAVGYTGVVAPMWSDGHPEDASVVADAYHKRLLTSRSTMNVASGETGAAYALHQAIQELREQVGESSFERWATFVHLGV